MAAKYRYELNYDAEIGDFLSGHIYWQVWMDNSPYGVRKHGWTHTKKSARRKVHRAVARYESRQQKKQKFTEEGYVDGRQ